MDNLNDENEDFVYNMGYEVVKLVFVEGVVMERKCKVIQSELKIISFKTWLTYNWFWELKVVVWFLEGENTHHKHWNDSIG